MNRYVREKWDWIEGCNGMRDGVLEQLIDADLSFNPGGDNLTFGDLILQMGEIQHSYLEGLKNRTQDWDYHNTEAGLAGSSSRLAEWFHAMDTELKELVAGFSDEQLIETVTRDGGYEMPIELSLDVYVQAFLIFFGKAVVYLKAMRKPLPPSIQEWIW